MSGSKRTSWLYIIGERALRENAGTSWGSRPVASVVRAEMNVPPSFGVWPNAGRPRASVPRVRPPAWSSWRRLRREARDAGSLLLMGWPPVRGSLLVGVEDVAQAVAQQVEGEDGDHDGDAGEDGDPGGGLEIGAPLIQHVAPGRRGRLGGQPEVAQR